MNESSSPAKVVRDVIAAADRLRRAEQSVRALAKAAPFAAAFVLVMALAGRVFAWSLGVTAGVAAVLAVAIALAMWAARRPRPVTDVIAAGIDTDAELSGELRSAYWFAASESPDDWTAFHLERAARRVSEITWAEVYPPVQASRAWIVSGALLVAAFLLPAGIPVWLSAPAAVSAAAESQDLPAELELLPPELQQQILEIMEALRTGKMTLEQALAALRELQGFSKLDGDLKQQLENSLKDVGELAEAADRTTDSDAGATQTSADVQWARENMASRMANEEAQKNQDGDGPPQTDPTGQPGMTDQEATNENSEASAAQATARVPAKEGAQTEGATGMMLRNGEAGDPGMAFGGKRGNVKYGTAEAKELAAALKKEQIEAIANLDNSNLKNEDKRRKTERSWSALRFTRVTGLSAFDRARAEAPHLVPEARRPLLERYFVRELEPEPPAGGSPPPAKR